MKFVKYFIITVILISMSSCVKYQPVGSNTSYSTEDFINLRIITSEVYVDTNTDVLYLSSSSYMTPIMKADGTCLTLTEWKATKGL